MSKTAKLDCESEDQQIRFASPEGRIRADSRLVFFSGIKKHPVHEIKVHLTRNVSFLIKSRPPKFNLQKIRSKNKKKKKGLLCGFLFRPLGFHIRDLVGLDAALRRGRRLRVFPFHREGIKLTDINTVPAHNTPETVECPDLLSPLNGDRLRRTPFHTHHA
jgi:hypothetical protein